MQTENLGEEREREREGEVERRRSYLPTKITFRSFREPVSV
jgi:hypothetical protein